MSGDVKNPRVWAGAEVFSAAPDTIDMSADGAEDALKPEGTGSEEVTGAGFEGVGLIGEDGISFERDQSSDDKYAQSRAGLVLVRTVRSKQKDTIKLMLLEGTDLAFKLLNPGSESSSSGGVTSRVVKVAQPDPRQWVVDHLDGDVIRRRFYPSGEITDVGEDKAADSELSGPEVTLTIYPDADGVKFYEWTNDPAAEASGS